MDVDILKSLQTLSPVEREQKKSHYVSDDIPPDAIDLKASQAKKVPVLNDFFFQSRSVYISKHSRFAPYPLHTHQFFEINYMLRGHATEYVDGKKVVLSEGDVLLLDIGSQHRIDALEENDLLINILFRDRNISIDLMNQAQAMKSVLYDFLLNQVSRQHSVQDYLLFKNNGANNRDIRITLESLIEEYHRQREFADTIINAQLTVLIARLIRNYQLPSAPVSPSQEIAIKILDDIRTHYRKLSLEELAQKYAYNKNYLSNLFRKEVGKPFSEVLTDERLLRAREMIQSTTKPIGDICHDVGIANKSFFYHKYADKFGHTPKEDRQNASPDTILKQL